MILFVHFFLIFLLRFVLLVFYTFNFDSTKFVILNFCNIFCYLFIFFFCHFHIKFDFDFNSYFSLFISLFCNF